MTDRDKEVSRPQQLVDDLWRECLRHRNAIYNGPSSDRPIAIANALRIATAAIAESPTIDERLAELERRVNVLWFGSEGYTDE